MDDLTFYAAYQQVGDKKQYLSNGKGAVRLFRDEGLLKKYLEDLLSPEDLARTVIHPVNGTIAVPVPETADEPMPISTLAIEAGAPSEVELLAERVKRHRHKAKR